MRLVNKYINTLKAAVLTFVLLFTITTNSFSQDHFPVDNETGKYNYSKVIYLDSVGKAELFKRATEWFAGYFTDGDLQEKAIDEATGTITCTVNRIIEINKAGEKTEVPLSFSLNIYIRGGRCKYDFTNIEYNDGDLPAEKKFDGKKLSNTDQQYLSKTKRSILPIEKSLIGAMTLNNADIIVRSYKDK